MPRALAGLALRGKRGEEAQWHDAPDDLEIARICRDERRATFATGCRDQKIVLKRGCGEARLVSLSAPQSPARVRGDAPRRLAGHEHAFSRSKRSHEPTFPGSGVLGAACTDCHLVRDDGAQPQRLELSLLKVSERQSERGLVQRPDVQVGVEKVHVWRVGLVSGPEPRCSTSPGALAADMEAGEVERVGVVEHVLKTAAAEHCVSAGSHLALEGQHVQGDVHRTCDCVAFGFRAERDAQLIETVLIEVEILAAHRDCGRRDACRFGRGRGGVSLRASASSSRCRSALLASGHGSLRIDTYDVYRIYRRCVSYERGEGRATRPPSGCWGPIRLWPSPP